MKIRYNLRDGSGFVFVNLKESEKNIWVLFRYNQKLVAEIKEVYENRKFGVATKTWKIPKTPRNLIALSKAIGVDLIDHPKLRTRTTNPQDPVPLPDFLWEAQRQMAEFIRLKKRCIIAAKMRSGKTLATISALRGEVERVIWVTPASTIQGLKLEFKKWLKGSLNISVITYHAFRNLELESVLSSGSVALVFDEAQALKNPDSIQGKKARKVGGYDFEYLILLSGTPAPKAPTDWWNLAEIVSPCFFDEGSVYSFKQRLGVFEEVTAFSNEGEHKFLKLKHWVSKAVIGLYSELSKITKVFDNKSFGLPDKIYEEIEVSTKPSKSLKLKIKRLLKTDELPIVIQTRLSQLSDGFETKEKISTDGSVSQELTYLKDNPKIEQLKVDLQVHLDSEECPRLVILCHFTPSVELCAFTAKKMGYKVLKISKGKMTNEDLLPEMDRSNPDGLSLEPICVVAQVDSASMGLEFSASSEIIYYSNSYNGGSRIQSEARCYSNNMNKEKGLLIKDYINLPIDRQVLNNLKTKKTLLKMSMGEIKNIFEEFIKD
jgi:SNF2 family DNA or RNA helicase